MALPHPGARGQRDDAPLRGFAPGRDGELSGFDPNFATVEWVG
jgi:hypothetical protein